MAHLVFYMRTNLALRANFVTNKFIAAAGTYNGLFMPAASLSLTNSGRIQLSLGTTGRFSGKLLLPGVTNAFKGQADPSGRARVLVNRRQGVPLTLDLLFSLDSGGDSVEGTVSDGFFVASLKADRARSFAGSTPFAGKYTFVIPGGDAAEASSRPAGDGVGFVTIAPNGTLLMSGTLGDGTAISQGSFLSKSGQWPLYSSLYAGKGMILGWVNFSASTTFPCVGTNLFWIKSPLPTQKYYPAGFSALAEMHGARYTAPARVENILGWTNGQVWLDGGNLAVTLTNDVRLTGSAVQISDSNSMSLRISITASNGLFTGSFRHPVTGAGTALRGAVLRLQPPDLGFGGGWFRGTNETGYIWLRPASTP